MTDLEITKLCAEAMGLDEKTLQVLESGWTGRGFDPLHDDTQAMALVKKLRLNCYYDGMWCSGPYLNDDLNRVICCHAAKIQAGK